MVRETKYIYEYVLQGYYSQGWEDLTASEHDQEGLKEIRADLKAYRDNEGGCYRIVTRRTLRKL